jgi:serine/threonine protein kinase
MEHGSLSSFLKKSNQTLLLPRRLEILRDIAEGLKYLHQEQIVHGDLTSMNILLDSDDRAILCDFGLSGVVAEVKSATFMTSTVSGNARWMAPELMELASEDTDEVSIIEPTYQSDMYSFGCLALETLSGKMPYHYYKTEPQVLLSISRGIKPRRSSRDEVSDKLWGFIQQCWAPAGQRISAELALECIRGFLQVADEKM